jgi:hypothetical protein
VGVAFLHLAVASTLRYLNCRQTED